MPRQPRFVSHALVEIRKFQYLPLKIHSAILLDISMGGFKAEFTAGAAVRHGYQYWLSIPLSPLGIYSPQRFVCKSECRWYDDKKMKMGGIFLETTRKDKILIEQIIDSLKYRSL